MRSVLETIIKSIVTQPEVVKINEIGGSGNYIILEIDVFPEDRGRIIGKEGKTYKIIYELMKIIASKNRKKVNLSIIE